MSPELLTVVVAVASGGVGAQVLQWVAGRDRRQARQLADLREETDRLSWEVVVLSEELIRLGGDPVRARLDAHRRYAEGGL